MDDYGKLWDNYSIEFNSKLVNSNGDWNKLDEDEQEIAALWKLFVDINNGGFDEERLNTADTQFYKTECEHFTKMAYEYYHQTLKKTVTPIDT